MNKNMNTLPAPTWNRLQVNHAPEQAGLPAPPQGGWETANSVYGETPNGVTVLSEAHAPCLSLVSGVGKETDDAIRESANTACHLRIEGTAESPFTVTHRLTRAQPVVFEHQTVHAAANSCVTLVQRCLTEEDAAGVYASLTQIVAEQGARVRLVQVQLLNESSRRWSAVAVSCAAGARVELVRAELGGALTVCGSRALLSGNTGRYDLYCAYYGDGDAILDFNDIAEHTGRETVSELHASGVLDGRAQKTLRGTIDFQRGAVYAVGHESEDVLLFSPDVRNRTAPLILCGEERVEGQHAASAGKLDENVLYYMASRGLNRQQAERLMVQARFMPTLDRLPAALREEAMELIGRRLDSREGR